MELILRPSRDLWKPRLWLPRHTSIGILQPTVRRMGMPRFACNSGDSLAIFTPEVNQPPASGYMVLNVRNGHLVLEAGAGSTDTAIFTGIMPQNYGGGGITVYVHWMCKTATSGTVGWDITFERDNANNHQLDSDAWATAQVIASTATNGTSGKVTVTSIAITAGSAGTDSVAAGDAFRIRVRNVAAGTATGNNQILAVHLKET